MFFPPNVRIFRFSVVLELLVFSLEHEEII